MLAFRRIFIDDVLIAETARILTNGKLYELFNDKERVGRFYSGDNYSFAEFNEEKIRIESKRQLLANSEYHIFNQYTGELIAHYKINSLGLKDDVTGNLFLANGYSYHYSEIHDHRKITKPKTWGLYRFDMTSEKHSISYYGRMTPNSFRGINPAQVFEGEIQSTEDSFLFPIVAGIFIIEEKFRLLEQQPD